MARLTWLTVFTLVGLANTRRLASSMTVFLQRINSWEVAHTALSCHVLADGTMGAVRLAVLACFLMATGAFATDIAVDTVVPTTFNIQVSARRIFAGFVMVYCEIGAS
jgi:hypothetical protein